MMAKITTKHLRSATITSCSPSMAPSGIEKRHKPTHAKQIKPRKAHFISFSSPSKVTAMLKRLKNTSLRTKTQRKTKYKTPRRINHKAKQSKSTARTTALERSIV